VESSEVHPNQCLFSTAVLSFLSRPIELIDSAGGIFSNAEDMNKWMSMILRDGLAWKGPKDGTSGTHLMPYRYWHDIFKSHSITGYGKSRSYPVLNSLDMLGLGWMNGYYRGWSMIFFYIFCSPNVHFAFISHALTMTGFVVLWMHAGLPSEDRRFQPVHGYFATPFSKEI